MPHLARLASLSIDVPGLAMLEGVTEYRRVGAVHELQVASVILQAGCFGREVFAMVLLMFAETHEPSLDCGQWRVATLGSARFHADLLFC